LKNTHGVFRESHGVFFKSHRGLPEQGAEGFFDLADGVEADAELMGVEALKIVLRQDDVAEAELLGFGNALLDAGYGTHLAREAYLASHTPSGIDGRIDVGREDGGNDGEVHSEVGDAQAAGNVDEDIFLRQFEADALLEYGQQHVETALVEACGSALGRAVGGSGDEGLCLDEEGTDALDGRGDGNAREAVVVVGEQQLGWVGDLSQSVLLHLVDAQFGGGAEAVLDGSQDAVHVVLVALELYDGVDDVFQNLRTGEGAFLGDVANEDDGHAAGLGKAQQGRGALAHLGDGACGGLDVLGHDGLDGVDDDELWLHFLNVVEDGLELVLAEEQERAVSGFSRGEWSLQSLCTHLELMGALLAADVEDAQGQAKHGLQGERGLADAGFAAQQDDAAGHQSAAKDAVQLLVLHVDARIVGGADVAETQDAGGLRE